MFGKKTKPKLPEWKKQIIRDEIKRQIEAWVVEQEFKGTAGATEWTLSIPDFQLKMDDKWEMDLQ